MYCVYQDREQLEDDLYQEEDRDSDGSEANSELEFHLYSQLHYSSNAGELELEEEVEGCGESKESQEKTTDADRELEHTEDAALSTPHINEIKKRQKKDKGKIVEKKKERSHSKGQTLSSSCFEEVIVIDSSGPEVISISDDDSVGEEGVCSQKGGQVRKLKTSTPAQQSDRMKKKWPSPPVPVDSSSSESDSDESETTSESSSSSDASDSDGLENWMILGRGKHDEDQSISLNVEGGSDTNSDAEEEGWGVSERDKEAQIVNKDKGLRLPLQRFSNRYYTNKNVQCRNCNKTGHLSKNCPDPKKLSPCYLCGTPGHMISECPNRHCNNCGLPGHLYESCSERAYWHKQCHRCGMKGHFFDACPEIWRQYHLTTRRGPLVKLEGEDNGPSPPHCYNCSRRGHFGHACTQKRMFSSIFATVPFINHYDTVQDVNRRQHRLKLKVKELKRNGCFPGVSETPVTPGPQKKKQKLSHHKNNHNPHQSANHHRPSSSHIYFKDSEETPNPKPNKFKQQPSTGNVKAWKPKRPVPTSRDPRPPAKLFLDESRDFPRGGAKAQCTERKMFRKKNMKRTKEFPKAGPKDGRADRLFSKHGSHQKTSESRTQRRKRARAKADRKTDASMYPTDENLFIIKQRKRSR